MATHPVESHIGRILKNVMIRVTQNMNIAMARCSLRTKIAQSMFGMGGITGESLINLLIDNHVYLNTGFSATLENLIESPFLMLYGRTTEEEFGRQPPIGDIDGLSGLLESFGDSP